MEWLLRGAWALVVYSLRASTSLAKALTGRGQVRLLPSGSGHNYNGLAPERQLRALRQGELPLGRLVNPVASFNKIGSKVYLPMTLLQRGCAVLGPPGAGKTEGILIPWMASLLRAGASVVTVDVKGDVYDRIKADIIAFGGKVIYWNIADPAHSQSWNWLDSISDMKDIEAAVQSILGRPRENDNQPYFYQRDCRWLRTFIQVAKAAHGAKAKSADLYNIISDQNALRSLFQKYPAVQKFGSDLRELFVLSGDEHAKAVSGLLNALHLLTEPNVMRLSSRSDFSIDDMFSRPTLLVIGARLAEGQVSQVLSSLILGLLLNRVFRRFGTSSGIPLFFLLDEAPRLKERINLEETLSIVRAARSGICLAAQDIGLLGPEREAILGNCATILTLRGVSQQTAKYLSGRLGARQEEAISVGRDQSSWFEPTKPERISRNLVTVPVLGETEIMYPPGEYPAVVQVSPVHAAPFIVELRRSG